MMNSSKNNDTSNNSIDYANDDLQLQKVGLIMIIPSCISMVASLLMMISLLTRKALIRKTSFRILFYLALSNFLTSLGSSVGFPSNGSATCYFEGIITNIFTLSSIFWNVTLTYLLYTICVDDKPYRINWITHVICWGLPTTVTFLPFANNLTYGGESDWCFLVDTSKSPRWALLAWIFLSFYAWVWLGVIIMISLIVYLYWKIYKSSSGSASTLIEGVFARVKWYPAVTIICWGIQTFFDVIYVVEPEISLYSRVFDGLSCCQGLFMTIIFLSTTKSLHVKILPINGRFDSLDSEFSVGDDMAGHAIQGLERTAKTEEGPPAPAKGTKLPPSIQKLRLF